MARFRAEYRRLERRLFRASRSREALFYRHPAKASATEHHDLQHIQTDQEKRLARNSFIEPAEDVFGLSFRKWHGDGFRTDRCVPYVPAGRGRAVANASVKLIGTVWRGTPRHYIQIGTVMTAPGFRDSCDAIYPYANSPAPDFHPKFGFPRRFEYQFHSPVKPGGGGDFMNLIPIRNLKAGNPPQVLRSGNMEVIEKGIQHHQKRYKLQPRAARKRCRRSNTAHSKNSTGSNVQMPLV